MFLSRRSRQAEYFDIERPVPELAEFFRALNRLNGVFAFAEPFQRYLPRMLGESRCRSLAVLDLGAGDGSLAGELESWASQRGWSWQVTSLDTSLEALSFGRGDRRIVGSALALPFQNGVFDVVITSQMTHHLSEPETVQLLVEAWRVAHQAILVCDLHRNVALYTLLWVFFRLQSYPPQFRHDALLSVQRSWRVGELRRLAQAAGIRPAHVRCYFGARLILEARKQPLTKAATKN